MFDDPSFDGARRLANEVMDDFRRHGSFEPHRLPRRDMECTTVPPVAAQLADRWRSIPSPAARSINPDGAGTR